MKVIDGKPKVHAATVGVLLERLANEDAQGFFFLLTSNNNMRIESNLI